MAEEWQGASSTLEDDEERRVLFAALDSFRQYRRAAHYNITHRRRQNFYSLPEKDWKILADPPFNILGHFDLVDDAIDSNADIANAILDSGLEAFGVAKDPGVRAPDWHGKSSPSDMEKAKSTIRQFYRDWSREGAVEREACYGPVLDDLQKLFPEDLWCTTKVLVPGAGLGRLVFEVCKLGFSVEGNEISFHQLMSSNWVLNQLQSVLIPDLHPATELAEASQNKSVHAFERMSMTAADFLVLYSNEDHQARFDVVVTVYFIDTAPNLIRYIETIYHTLRPGGYWINLGPLLWHFEEGPASSHQEHAPSSVKHQQKLGIGEPGSVEMVLEDVMLLIERMGFQVKQQRVFSPGVGYIQDPCSMLSNTYSCSHFIAQRGT